MDSGFKISGLRSVCSVLPPLLLVLTFTSPGHSGVSSEEIVNRLQSTYRGVQDLQADFIQTSSLQGFGEKVYEGRLYIKNPKMARWNYRKPEKQNIVIKDDTAILYFPGQRQAIIQTISGNPDAEPAMGLLTDIDKWQELYNIKAEDAAVDIFRIELRPISTHTVEKVIVELEKKTLHINKLTIYEESGNRISFNFSAIKFNSNLKESLFDFKIPKGVEILEW